jgi:ArsR family transcriptional regulator, virulence genes transcriptional regulator
MDDMIKLQSELCKTFTNPFRMQIIKLLYKKEMQASELIQATEMSKANLSQHMAILVKNGIVDSKKEGRTVYYSLSDPKIRQACSIMQDIMVNTIKRKNSMVENNTIGRQKK